MRVTDKEIEQLLNEDLALKFNALFAPLFVVTISFVIEQFLIYLIFENQPLMRTIWAIIYSLIMIVWAFVRKKNFK